MIPGALSAVIPAALPAAIPAAIPTALAVAQTSELPTAASPIVIGVALAYFVGVAGIAIWASRRTKTSEDFFLAGKNIGLIALTLAAMASTFSSFTFIGGPGLLYTLGFGAMLYTLPASITNILAAWVLAKRLRLLVDVRPILTIPDALAVRFGGCRTTQGLAAGGVIAGAIGYMGTQVLGLGVVMDALFGIGIPAGIWIGTVIVTAYAASGGILAGIYTDVLQGIIMAVASLLVFLFALDVGGGMTQLTSTILSADPAWTSPWGTGTTLSAMSLYFVFSVGVLGQPHVMHKFFMLRDPKQLKWYPLLVTIAMIVVILLMLGVGTAVKYLVVTGGIPEADLADANAVAPIFLLRFTPALLAAVVFAGIAAAVMSTVDSFVNVGAAAITHDLPTALGRPLKNELLWGRIATVGLGLASAALAHVAFASSTLVAFLGIFGYGVFAASLAPALAIGMNWKRATRAGAIASIGLGLGSSLTFGVLDTLGIYRFPGGITAAAISLSLSFVAFLGVSLLTSKGQVHELDEEVQVALRL